MFGLTFEKLFFIALLAAIVIGPRRLPEYAGHLGRGIRRLRALVDGARETVTETTGVPIDQWRTVDLSRYDPRRIVRDALADEPGAVVARADAAASADETAAVLARADAAVRVGETAMAPAEGGTAEVAAVPEPVVAARPAPARTWTDDEIAAVRPGQRYVVVGGSAHPCRIAIAELPDGDPVRRAAETVPVGEQPAAAVPVADPLVEA